MTSFDLPANQTEWGPADEPMFVQCELHISGLYCSELHGGVELIIPNQNVLYVHAEAVNGELKTIKDGIVIADLIKEFQREHRLDAVIGCNQESVSLPDDIIYLKGAPPTTMLSRVGNQKLVLFVSNYIPFADTPVEVHIPRAVLDAHMGSIKVIPWDD